MPKNIQELYENPPVAPYEAILNLCRQSIVSAPSICRSEDRIDAIQLHTWLLFRFKRKVLDRDPGGYGPMDTTLNSETSSVWSQSPNMMGVLRKLLLLLAAAGLPFWIPALCWITMHVEQKQMSTISSKCKGLFKWAEKGSPTLSLLKLVNQHSPIRRPRMMKG